MLTSLQFKFQRSPNGRRAGRSGRSVRLLATIVLGVQALSLFRSTAEARDAAPPEPLSFPALEVQGELGRRLAQNFDRLEETKYQPDHVFLTLKQSGNWPGDTEGRTILGLTLEAQAAHRQPKYLEEILRRLPSRVNEKGFFGNILPPGMADEQQLSGHGWLLRGLCEYYLWQHDPATLHALNRLIDNLVLPTKGLHERYPTDPSQRVHGGGPAGTISRQLGSWLVSTDIGCDFIFLDGVVQAYQVTRREELKPLIQEIIGRFLQIDLRAIKAQTHASLTGMRALLRWYEITREPSLLRAVSERFNLYRQYAMTENYENYNWFGRPEGTEPCAVVDSYMVALGLWRWSGNPEYAALAQRIYYNGLAFEQRANGGFGTQKCSGANMPLVAVSCQEAHWCCTMRGGEGLARVAQSCFYTDAEGLYVLHFNDATARFSLGSGKAFELREETRYPFEPRVRFTVTRAESSVRPVVRLLAPPWVTQPMVTLNGQRVKTSLKKGFVNVRERLQTGDVLEYEFKMASGAMPLENVTSTPGFRKLYYGPLVLACAAEAEPLLPKAPAIELLGDRTFRVEGSPVPFGTVYHLLNEEVKNEPLYRRRMLFPLPPALAQASPPAANSSLGGVQPAEPLLTTTSKKKP